LPGLECNVTDHSYTDYTAEKYFEHNRERLFPTGQNYVAAACLKHLLRSPARLAHCRNVDELEHSLEHDPLFKYASQYWGKHAGGKVEASVRDLIRDFLRAKAIVTRASQMLLVKTSQRYFAHSGQPLPTGITGIHICSAFGLLQTITDALCNGADPDSKDSDDRTPLSWAAEKGQSEVVTILLTHKNVDINSKDSRGETPISWAVNNGQVEVVRQLLSRGDLDVNTRSQDDMTPLWSAAIHGYMDVMELLLSRNDADPNLALPRYGQTMLWWAARTGRDVTVQSLLSCGNVAINSKDSDYGQSPLSSAARNGHAVVVKMLLEQSSVDANSRDVLGRTPLSWSAEKGHESVMRLLLGHPDIDVKCKDDNGRAPLWWAAKHGHKAVVEMLLGKPVCHGDEISHLNRHRCYDTVNS
jgi:ankyrin repeat protein